MATAGGSIQLKVSKSTLSMFLRTKCDKELFLSLHDKKAMAAAGLPEPIKRPGIGILAVHGKDFEIGRNDQLVRLFGGIVQYSKNANQYGTVDLQSVLTAVRSAPQLILQGHFSIGAQQSTVLSTIGVDAADISQIPPITDFVPDIFYIRDAKAGDQEVLPNGTRGPINELIEPRKAICVFDVKHTSESNPSYCSEIAMYAVMLANWLQARPQLACRFFVSLDARLWTRHNQVDSNLDKAEAQAGTTQQALLDALIADSEDAQLRFYLPTIRSFFNDVARVVRMGKTPGQGWQALDWHISGSCSACDWLGDRRHMGQAHRNVVDVNPGHYCMPLAESTGHLCLVPGITRGAKKVLHQNTVADTAALAGALGHPALQLHTLLKKEAKAFPARSAAINSGNVSRDITGAIASLVRAANILLYASINFDSSSGFLTGLALSGVATTFTAGQSPRRFRPIPFIVDDKSLLAEWVALEGFLTQIATWIETAEQMKGGASITGQIHFWEQRQFQELCNAMGRHLPRVLALSARRAKALAWVFAGDEMLERADSVEAATIVTVEDIVRRLVFAPSRHVITLFDTVERYRRSQYSPAITDSYYREYLSNGIPRERIYELWAHTPQVKRGATTIPRNTLIAQYSDALERQSSALESVCEKLREDYRGQFRAKEARIPVSVPRGASSVAFDAKLWLWWDDLDFNTSQLDAHIGLSMDGERREAVYEAIVLHTGMHLSGDLYQFNVAASSSEAKFKEDSRLTIGKIGTPGMPLQRVGSIVDSSAPPFHGTPEVLQMPLWSAVEARLVAFDRVRLTAQVEIICRRDASLVPYLMQHSCFSLLNDIFLVEAKKPKMFNWAEFSQPILQAIGNPRIATPDPNAVRAIGVAPPARRTYDIESPAARVLWAPGVLQQQVVLTGATAGALANAVQISHSLNDSQRNAIVHALERQLTVIWGPPGTGKTNTLAAMLHAMTVQAVTSSTPLRILVTGPTYKAVEEVMHRAAKFLSQDPIARCAMFVGYSKGRALGSAPQGIASHISYDSMVFEPGNAEWQTCTQLLAGGSGVTIVGCQVMQSRQFAKALGASPLHPVFDVVVVDESSQVPVPKALAAFSGLRDDARVIIAGDHLQMPPISSIEAPKDAAYLVGSIQTYLLDRPFAVRVQKCVLDTNYRSADHIVDFARTIGYPQSLTAAYGNCRLHMIQPPALRPDYWPSFPWAQVFDRVLHPNTIVATVLHEDDISSQGNRYEAQIVANLVRGLRHSVSGALDNWGLHPQSHFTPGALEFWSECVGIVTPHRAQRALVVQALTEIWPTEADHISDAVDTVERFQGGERHTIIVTFGVADVDVISGEETFLMQLERTNVAISRAMAKCIVVMPRALAAHVPEDKRALETAFAIKDFVEDFCNQRVDDILQSPLGNRGVQIRYRS